MRSHMRLVIFSDQRWAHCPRWLLRGPGGAASRLLAALALTAGLVAFAHSVPAQGFDGATMTVLAGQVAVIHSDGTAIQPAPSGTTVYPLDEIHTLDSSGALITFFSGTEIELGEDTVLVVERVSRDGERVDVSLRQVFGVAINRVAALADTGSSYRIEAGGSVAVVRGTGFVVGVMPPFAAMGCAEGLVAVEFVNIVCPPGKLLSWEFDLETGTRISDFKEKTFPPGDLSVALNAVVSTLGDLLSVAQNEGDDDDDDGSAGGGSGGSAGEGSGGSTGGGGSGGGPVTSTECPPAVPDYGNSEEAHAVRDIQLPSGLNRGDCISTAAHERNATNQAGGGSTNQNTAPLTSSTTQETGDQKGASSPGDRGGTSGNQQGGSSGGNNANGGSKSKDGAKTTSRK
jgi:hypothetical protein